MAIAEGALRRGIDFKAQLHPQDLPTTAVQTEKTAISVNYLNRIMYARKTHDPITIARAKDHAWNEGIYQGLIAEIILHNDEGTFF